MNLRLAAALIFMSVVVFSTSAHAAQIEVEIPEEIGGEARSFSKDVGDLTEFKMEFYDIGSIPYTARMRVDLFKDSELIFTGWSGESEMTPGRRTNFDILWYGQETGKIDGRLRMYFANEIVNQEFVIEKGEMSSAESVFDVSSFRTHDDYVIFDLVSEKDVGGVVVIPDDYPLGWVFEQVQIGDMKAGERKIVVLPYEPTLFVESTATIVVVSDAGAYVTYDDFEMRKDTSIGGMITRFFDDIRASYVLGR